MLGMDATTLPSIASSGRRGVFGIAQVEFPCKYKGKHEEEVRVEEVREAMDARVLT